MSEHKGEQTWQAEKSRSSKSRSTGKPSSSVRSSADRSALTRSLVSTVPTTTPVHLGLGTNIVRQFYSGIPEADQLAPSGLIFKGVPLIWKSQEVEPEHIFHWDDDPRKHPWCRKCRERNVPNGAFTGVPTERPAPPTAADWAVKDSRIVKPGENE